MQEIIETNVSVLGIDSMQTLLKAISSGLSDALYILFTCIPNSANHHPSSSLIIVVIIVLSYSSNDDIYQIMQIEFKSLSIHPFLGHFGR